MCSFTQPKAPAIEVPAVPAAPQAPAATPQESDPAVQSARDDERKRKLQQAAANNTLVTGGQGLTAPANTGLKTAFGA